MTAKKTAAPKAAAVDFTAQAYKISAHALVTQNGWAIGDKLQINNFINRQNDGRMTDRVGLPLPPGCTLTGTDVPAYLYGHEGSFRGINDAGNLVINVRSKDVQVPYNFVLPSRENQDEARASVKLNESYKATIMGKGDTVVVGCQRFKLSVIKELVATADKVIATRAATVAAKVPAASPLSANPAATYVPSSARVVASKPVAKKAAKKAPAKRR